MLEKHRIRPKRRVDSLIRTRTEKEDSDLVSSILILLQGSGGFTPVGGSEVWVLEISSRDEQVFGQDQCQEAHGRQDSDTRRQDGKDERLNESAQEEPC